MNSSKKKEKKIPFQIVTRNRARVIPSGIQKEVKVVLKKMSPTQIKFSGYGLKKNKTSTSKIQSGSVEKIDASCDGSSSSSQSNKKITSSCTQQSSPKAKEKMKKRLSIAKSGVKKPKLAVKSVKKACRFSSKKVAAGREVKTPFKAKGNKGSKSCGQCEKNEGNINLLQNKIKELEEKEESAQKKIIMYEGFGLKHLQKEEEKKLLLKKRQELQSKLNELECELEAFVYHEDEEISSLEKKRDSLESDFTENKKKHKKLDAEEKAILQEIEDGTEAFRIYELQLQKERADLLEELAPLEKK